MVMNNAPYHLWKYNIKEDNSYLLFDSYENYNSKDMGNEN